MILLHNVSLNNKVCDILIDKNKITKISDKINTQADEVIDCTDKAILPSFCNTHTHASMMFLRGIGEDKNLFDWLNQEIFPREAKLKPEHIYPLSRYAILEMIKTGTTCFVDMTIKTAKEQTGPQPLRPIRYGARISTAHQHYVPSCRPRLSPHLRPAASAGRTHI